MNQEEQSRKMNQIIAKCWADEAFKQQLLADPVATLKAEGMPALPEGMTVKVVENTDSVFHLVIPAKPSELSDDDLDKVAGGDGGWLLTSYGTAFLCNENRLGQDSMRLLP